MKRYNSYKDSNIEWIGDIPENWEVTKLKFLGDAFGGLTYSPDNVVEDAEKGVLVLRSSNIQNGNLSLKDNVYVDMKISKKLTLRKGDILICSRNGSQRLIGKNICIDERTEGTTFGAFMMIFRSPNWKFLKHFFNSPIFTSQSSLFLTATINQLTSNTINNFWIAIPKSKEEQEAIAEYLDKKTLEIEILVAKKKQLITLLKEERTAIINHAVVKGIDHYVKLKDSGIEWIGEVPEHWEITRLANIGKFYKGRGVTKADLTDEGVSVILYGDLYTKYGIMTTSVSRKTSREIANNAIQLCKGDLLFTASGETKEDIGKCLCFLSDEETVASGDVIIFRQQDHESLYLSYVFNSYNIIAQKAKLSKGEIVVHIYSSQLRSIAFALPPVKEQIEITKFLNAKTSEIDSIIIKTEKEIELMQEYKAALISEVVTGKIDVREEVLV